MAMPPAASGLTLFLGKFKLSLNLLKRSLSKSLCLIKGDSLSGVFL